MSAPWQIPVPTPFGQKSTATILTPAPMVYTPSAGAHVAASAPPVSGPPLGVGDVSQFRRVDKAGPRVIPVAPAVVSTGPAQSYQPPQQHQAPVAPAQGSYQQQDYSRPAAAPAASAPPVAAAVDPSRVPCPADRYRGERTTYNCAPREQVPPPSDSDFLAIDDGNASCRFVRSTLYAIPSTADALKKSCLPFSLVVTPLARPQPGERLVPLADYANEAGPLRCSRCMAYACHAVTWSGRSFLCPVCEASTAVPDHLFSALLPNGRRMDAENRPEFYAGSVDLLVSNLFRHNERKSALPLANVYLIDVSFNAQKTGVMHTMIAAVRSVIEHLDETQNHHVALLTYSNTVHCYDCGTSLSRPKMLVLAGGPEDVSAPSVVVQVRGNGKKNLLYALDSLGQLHEGGAARQECDAVRAIKAAASLLGGRGGRVLLMTTANPLEKDRLRDLAAKNVLGTDEERVLYDLDSSNSVWKELCAALVAASVSVDAMVATQSFVDVGSLQWLCSKTAGRVYYYPDVAPGAYELKMQEELRSRQTRLQGYDAVVRIRCSRGLTVTGYRGAFSNDRVSDELELAAIDETTTLNVDLAVEGTMPGASATVQIATLFTTSSGQRVVRLHTLVLAVAPELQPVFRLADVDATVYWTASTAVATAGANGVKFARGEVARRTGEILSAYRTYCAKSPAPGQLILPEALKHLPAYVLGLLKSPLLRPSTSISPHLRCHYLRCVLPFMQIAHVLPLCYPLALPLHALDLSAQPDPSSGLLPLPPALRLLKSSLASEGATLFDDGLSLRIFFGAEAAALVAELASPPWAAPEVDLRACPWDSVPRTEPWALRAEAIVTQRRMCDPAIFKNVRMSRAGDPDEANLMAAVLVEDAVSSSMSLTGFLKHLHQKITAENK